MSQPDPQAEVENLYEDLEKEMKNIKADIDDASTDLQHIRDLCEDLMRKLDSLT